MNDEALMGVNDVAHMLSIAPSTVRSWLWSGKLPRVRLSGRAVRVKLADVRRLIQDRTETATGCRCKAAG